MVAEEYELVKIQVPGQEARQVQFKVHAEAPAGGAISRQLRGGHRPDDGGDVSELNAQASQVPALQFLQAVGFTELAAPIGTPDVELNLFMTNEGMQFEWVDTADGQRSRWTSTWAEMFAK
jgi:hypothetical protein